MAFPQVPAVISWSWLPSFRPSKSKRMARTSRRGFIRRSLCNAQPLKDGQRGRKAATGVGHSLEISALLQESCLCPCLCNSIRELLNRVLEFLRCGFRSARSRAVASSGPHRCLWRAAPADRPRTFVKGHVEAAATRTLTMESHPYANRLMAIAHPNNCPARDKANRIRSCSNALLKAVPSQKPQDPLHRHLFWEPRKAHGCKWNLANGFCPHRNRCRAHSRALALSRWRPTCA